MSRLRLIVRHLSLILTPFTLLLALVIGSGPTPLGASSHREAPLIAKDPSVDPTDVYAFVSPDAPTTVTLIANWIPFQDATGGPNFYHFDDNARYNIKVDRDGDAKADIIYRWTFKTIIKSNSASDPTKHTFLYNTNRITALTDAAFNYTQTYSVTKITLANGAETGSTVLFSNRTMVPDNVGPRSFASYEQLVAGAVGSANGYKEFTGQRDDPFFVDIGAIFDLGGLRPFNNLHLVKLPVTGGLDDVGGFNIHTTALQIPRNELTPECPEGTAATNPKCVIGVWTTADRPRITVRADLGGEAKGTPPTGQSEYVQVSRLGNPLVNEAVLPLSLKDAFNALDPSLDAVAYTGGADALFGGAPIGAIMRTAVLTPELQRLLPVLYPGVFNQSGANKNLPDFPRTDLQTIFLTGIPGINAQEKSVATPSEQLRLNVAIPPNNKGVCKGEPLGAMAGDLAGWPNGRRLEDDVTDMAIRAVAGGYGSFLNQQLQLPNLSPGNLLTDGANVNDKACLASFPYMGTPHSGYDDFHPFISRIALPLVYNQLAAYGVNL